MSENDRRLREDQLQVTCPKGRLSEGSFVRNGVAQIPKLDAKPNPNPMPIRFGQMTLRTSELSLEYHIVGIIDGHGKTVAVSIQHGPCVFYATGGGGWGWCLPVGTEDQ